MKMPVRTRCAFNGSNLQLHTIHSPFSYSHHQCNKFNKTQQSFTLCNVHTLHTLQRVLATLQALCSTHTIRPRANPQNCSSSYMQCINESKPFTVLICLCVFEIKELIFICTIYFFSPRLSLTRMPLKKAH